MTHTYDITIKATLTAPNPDAAYAVLREAVDMVALTNESFNEGAGRLDDITADLEHVR